ncbi:ABC transporter B family member 25 [Hordeum vulgare]|nr:ABC transporter B family member 25 [Hordeum vulgare]
MAQGSGRRGAGRTKASSRRQASSLVRRRSTTAGTGGALLCRRLFLRRGGPSDATLLPVKREWAVEPEDRHLVIVKQEPEEIARRGVVGPKDYVGDEVDMVAAAIGEWSLHEEAKRRHHDEELEDLLFKQAGAANLVVKDKDDERWRIREEKREKFIDLVSSHMED